MSVDVLRMGLVGCGVMGRSLAENAASLSCCEVVGVSDLVEERGHGLASDLTCDYLPAYEELFARSDVDAVLIATPPFSARSAGSGCGWQRKARFLRETSGSFSGVVRSHHRGR